CGRITFACAEGGGTVSDDELTAEEVLLLDDIEAMLADPSLWTEASPEVEEVAVSAIVAAAAGASTSTYHVYRRPGRGRRWLTTAGAAVVGAAAAGVITFLVTRDPSPVADARVAVVGTDLAPGISGSAELTTVASGVEIELRLPGLPRRDNGDFYQVWLKNCEGTQLVPAGSFHELDDAIAWAGVAPEDFPLITVTKEAVAPPKDAAQGTSGEVVAKGAIAECPT
ncbi:MAG: anti-sigma factor, partial [Ilumatobacteraceae bacterium]